MAQQRHGGLMKMAKAESASRMLAKRCRRYAGGLAGQQLASWQPLKRGG
jgi:hypothetical protein